MTDIERLVALWRLGERHLFERIGIVGTIGFTGVGLEFIERRNGLCTKSYGDEKEHQTECGPDLRLQGYCEMRAMSNHNDNNYIISFLFQVANIQTFSEKKAFLRVL